MSSPQFLRNIGTLTEEEQTTIEGTKIAVAGCGLGSEVSRQLARFGFQITALADLDTVELHNLNRQSYYQKHIGEHKAHAVKDVVQQINPAQDPKIYDNGITYENIPEFVSLGDIVIDAVDPSAIYMSLALTREAHKQGKTVITAIDFGFGARLFVFPPEGVGIMEFMNVDPNTPDSELSSIPTEVIMRPYMDNIPHYSLDIIMRLAHGELDYYPQNMLAVGQAGLLITAACKRVALKQGVVTAPEYVHIDLDQLIER